MRNTIWSRVIIKIPQGMLLPWWALMIRALLFPLDSFYWYMHRDRGYRLYDDMWLIEGVLYSGETFRNLVRSDGEIYRIKYDAGTVFFERMYHLEEIQSNLTK